MSTGFQVAYLPIGVPTFHLESAEAEFQKSCDLLHSITEDVVCPKEMLLSLDILESFLSQIHPDLIILQNVTFANSAYASKIIKKHSCPILLWTLREPVIDGSRLRLNSLTGAYSAANAMVGARQGQFAYLFGSPEEPEVQSRLSSAIRAVRLKRELSQLKIATVGHTPEGFGFGRASDIELLRTFGTELESVELRELLDRAKGYSEDECRQYLEETQACTACFDITPERNQKDHARLYRAYREYAEEHQIGALASRCWPDCFTAYGTPVCTVLSLLNDRGIAASCEADTYGALSMFMGMKLTGSACFFGDPVSLDEKENTVTYWHCGMAACSLAHPGSGAQTGVHPNRKIGPVMDFGCKPNPKVTLFRVGRKADGAFRFFLAAGQALDKPKQFSGTSIVVKTVSDCRSLVERSVQDGWEPHFVVIYGDVQKELTMLAHMLNIEVWGY